ncbi:hypothetical protein Amet_3976 [Alkaliphilus metalliredigens QYMF]|uniref:Uncharacterized protein n=1 Tax=Alkaliphilus metalliredigens (strain QYMF) TaxID=293826 RepID=A6TV43_ALKMQ|nr:ABC-three component system middle component 1 [Alkaliphilus metalliredigens]ABR50061.1 hypothetical protein Amet_3976 [Alkaliphilus metalliredigens QYMF]
MKLEELSSYMDRVIEQRFEKESSIDISKHLSALDEQKLDKQIFRLKRKNKPELKTYRTFLLVQINETETLKNALQWVAAVKNSLTDPETSDLYLIVISENDVFTIDESMRIEATESFCKKYVQRGDENPESLIKRTCLANFSVISEDTIQIDPVNTVFLKTQQEFSWFDAPVQQIWKEAFNSDDNGNELLERIR